MTLYLVSYDIADSKRWRKVHKIAQTYGRTLQFSVFLCAITETQKVQMLTKLLDVTTLDDRLLVVNLGTGNGVQQFARDPTQGWMPLHIT